MASDTGDEAELEKVKQHAFLQILMQEGYMSKQNANKLYEKITGDDGGMEIRYVESGEKQRGRNWLVSNVLQGFIFFSL